MCQLLKHAAAARILAPGHLDWHFAQQQLIHIWPAVQLPECRAKALDPFHKGFAVRPLAQADQEWLAGNLSEAGESAIWKVWKIRGV